MKLVESKVLVDWRRIGLGLWCVLLLLVVLAHWYPIRDGMTRAIIVAGTACLWAGGLWLVWPSGVARRTLPGLSALPILFLVSPARETDRQALRNDYVRALRSYTGTAYVWGGETSRGIDCSGLMRASLIDASLKQGVRTLNPGLIRSGFSLWWNDCSAKAMSEEYRGTTHRLWRASTINSIDPKALLPGDMAVTADGVHVLAYLGNSTWIEADPNNVVGNRVIQVLLPTRNPWFSRPVDIVRWRALSGVE